MKVFVIFFGLILGCAMANDEEHSNICKPRSCPQDSPILLLPVPNNCAQFISCLNGKPTLRTCNQGQLFDEERQSCKPASETSCTPCEEPSSSEEFSKEDDAEEFRVFNGPIVQNIEPRNNISERCIKNSVTPVKCPYISSEDRLLPHPDDCHLFYYCINNALPPICRDCPADLHFNPVKKVCDHADVAGCQTKSKRAVNFLSEANRELMSCEKASGPFADLRPNPNDCGKYFVCEGNYLIPMNCPEGLHFSVFNKVCDYPDRANCKANLTEPNGANLNRLKYAVKTEAKNANFKVLKSGVDLTCDPLNGEFADLRPDPEDCNKYYVCDWGTLIHMSCPDGLHFSTAFKLCDLPSNARCSISTTTNIPQIKTTLEESKENQQDKTDASKVQCSTSEDVGEIEILPDPLSCETFYICSYGVPYQKKCPPGLYFNPKLRVCDYPEDSGCQLVKIIA